MLLGAEDAAGGADAPGVRRRCSPAMFTKLFHRVVQTCNVKEEAMQRLYALFSPHPPTASCPVLPEVSLTLWAFTPSLDAWNATLKLLLHTLRPRVYTTAETRPAQHEVFMVVCTKPLRTTPAMFERWMSVFVEQIGMSAGHVCFGEYFGEQMLGSMMRIKQHFTAFHSWHSMPNPYDRDFCLLYDHLAQQRRNEASARDMTGKSFTLSNFVHLHMQNARLATQLRTYTKDKQTWTQRRSKLARMICALGHVNAINVDTWKELLILVGEVPEQTTAETFRVYTAFARAQVDEYGNDVVSRPDLAREALPRPSFQQIPPHASTLAAEAQVRGETQNAQEARETQEAHAAPEPAEGANVINDLRSLYSSPEPAEGANVINDLPSLYSWYEMSLIVD